jgi:hypothetical protein
MPAPDKPNALEVVALRAQPPMRAVIFLCLTL